VLFDRFIQQVPQWSTLPIGTLPSLGQGSWAPSSRLYTRATVTRPDSDHAWYGKRRLHVNVNEYAVRDLRAYDPHGELTRKIYVIRKQALTADERRILQPWHWMPEHAALPGRQWRYRIAGLEDRRS
jgi:hypothetical protein